jgi:uracil-DNA glycosylase family 4
MDFDVSSDAKEHAFMGLVANVKSCDLCPRMSGRMRVLGPSNGDPHARVMFVAEAPGRLGADRSGIPLHGDQTGRRFETLLNEAGLDRGSVFLTNAVLCNPRDSQGRNSAPLSGEVHNCSNHLRTLIELVDPLFVVSLGRVALHALSLVESHGMQLSSDVGRVIEWHGRRLIPLYHPGPRALIHRELQFQLADFRLLGARLRDAEISFCSARTRNHN